MGLLKSDKNFLQSEVRNLELKFDEKAKENEGNISKKLELEGKVRTHLSTDSGTVFLVVKIADHLN